MVRRRQRERSLFEVLLPDGHKLWPEWLRRIDTLLEDEAVIEAVAEALEARWPQSRRRGRPGTPAEVVLRMLVLKHLFDWSYDDLEREVRPNLVYRAFTRIDAGEVPDAKTILKIAHVLGPDAVAQLHRRVVDVARRAGVTHGRRFRIDTTVVETNVHYPTDSSLLQDGVRVLTRTMQRASTALGDQPGRIRNRLRSVMRRVLIIDRPSPTGAGAGYDLAGGERTASARAGAHECLVAAIHPGAGYQRRVAGPHRGLGAPAPPLRCRDESTSSCGRREHWSTTSGWSACIPRPGCRYVGGDARRSRWRTASP